MTERVARIDERELGRVPPERPCPDFKNHIAEHREVRGDWRRMVLQVLGGVLIAIGGALVGAHFGSDDVVAVTEVVEVVE